MEEKYAAEALENGINIPIKDIGETSPISFMEVMKDAKLTKMQEGVCKSIRTKMRNRECANRLRLQKAVVNKKERAEEKARRARMFASEKVETQARRARIKELQSILKGRNEWKWRILDLAYVIGQSNHPEDLRIALSNDRDREVYNALLQENI